MIQIDGAIRIVPIRVNTDVGVLKLDDNKEEPAVIQSLLTASGIFQIIYPASAMESIIEGLTKAKNETGNNIYIPRGGLSEADALKATENEIRNTKK